MELIGVRVEVPTNQPIVLLKERDGDRHVPIFVGPQEATAIVYALQGMPVPRPMTHDLFVTVLEEFDAHVDAVEISQLEEGTFHADLVLTAGGQTHRLSARPSDSIALLVRCPYDVPILAADEVVEEAAITFESETEEAKIEEFREFLEQVDPEDFKQ